MKVNILERDEKTGISGLKRQSEQLFLLITLSFPGKKGIKKK